MENNIDGFIIGIEGYSETFNHLVKMSELNDICKMLKEKDKKIYIMLNKVYFNEQFYFYSSDSCERLSQSL